MDSIIPQYRILLQTQDSGKEQQACERLGAKLWGGQGVMWGKQNTDRIRYEASLSYSLVKRSYPKYYQLDLNYKYAHNLAVSS